MWNLSLCFFLHTPLATSYFLPIKDAIHVHVIVIGSFPKQPKRFSTSCLLVGWVLIRGVKHQDEIRKLRDSPPVQRGNWTRKKILPGIPLRVVGGICSAWLGYVSTTAWTPFQTPHLLEKDPKGERTKDRKKGHTVIGLSLKMEMAVRKGIFFFELLDGDFNAVKLIFLKGWLC